MSHEASIGRIPFRPEEEAKVRSMARLMKFVGVFLLIGGILGALFFLLWVALFNGLDLGPNRGFAIRTTNTSMSTILTIYGFLIALFLYMGFCLWQGVLLISASTSITRVATTDDSDQEHIALAFRRLRGFFMIEMVFGILGAILAILGIFD